MVNPFCRGIYWVGVLLFLPVTLCVAVDEDEYLQALTNPALREKFGVITGKIYYASGPRPSQSKTGMTLRTVIPWRDQLLLGEPILKQPEISFGELLNNWRAGIRIGDEKLDADTLDLEVFVENHSPHPRFLLLDGGSDVAIDLVAVDRDGKVIQLIDPFSQRLQRWFRFTSTWINPGYCGRFVYQCDRSRLNGAFSDYVVYAVVKIPAGRHVEKLANGETRELSRQETVQLLTGNASLNLTSAPTAASQPMVPSAPVNSAISRSRVAIPQATRGASSDGPVSSVVPSAEDLGANLAQPLPRWAFYGLLVFGIVGGAIVLRALVRAPVKRGR